MLVYTSLEGFCELENAALVGVWAESGIQETASGEKMEVGGKHCDVDLVQGQ